MSKLYVAYGSNLNLSQMASRCPSASVYAKGVLKDWALVYRGSLTNSHATIIKKKGSEIPVLIWEIQPIDEYRLDIYEGYPSYYSKQNIMVDIAGSQEEAMIYIMNKRESPGRPTNQYIRTIWQGYRDNSMDTKYFFDSLEYNDIELKQIEKGGRIT